jgi:hypothetical protein
MLKRLFASAVFAALVAAPLALVAQDKPVKTTVCKDGTKTTKTGEYRCEDHHGVDKNATKTYNAKTGADKAVAATEIAGENTGKAVAKGATDAADATAKGATDAAKATKKAAGQTSDAVSKGAEDVGKTAKGTAAETMGDDTNNKSEGAIAKCKDSSFSHMTSHAGACAKHGGVFAWLDGKAE